MKNLGKLSVDFFNNLTVYSSDIQELNRMAFAEILEEELLKCRDNKSFDDLKFFVNVIKKRLEVLKKF